MNMNTSVYINPILYKFPWVGPCFLLSVLFAIGSIIFKNRKTNLKNICIFGFIICLLACFGAIIIDSNPNALNINNTPLMIGIIVTVCLLILCIIKFGPYVKQEPNVIMSMFVIPPFLGGFAGLATYLIQNGIMIFGIFIAVFIAFWVWGFLSGKTINMTVNGKNIVLSEATPEEQKLFEFLDNLKNIDNVSYSDTDNYIIIWLNDYSEIEFLEKLSWTKEELKNYISSNPVIKQGMINIFKQNPLIMAKYKGIRVEVK